MLRRVATMVARGVPYGELFTAVSYPLAFLPLPVAFWVIKVVVVLLSLGFLSLVVMGAPENNGGLDSAG